MQDPTICAVVASAGATNTGAIDDLAGVAAVCADRGWWLHVDAAYGGAALAVPELAGRFAGIGAADSVVIDPHKWLFAPLDCAAVLYRDPALAALTHRQTAGYLDAFGQEHTNPSDLAFHLTRRARGLPLWFALVVHGTDAFVEAVRAGVDLAHRAAAMVRRAGPPLRLVMEPELSVVLFEREGWSRAALGRVVAPLPSTTAWRSSRPPRGTAARPAASSSSTPTPTSPPSPRSWRTPGDPIRVLKVIGVWEVQFLDLPHSDVTTRVRPRVAGGRCGTTPRSASSTTGACGSA